MKSTLVAVFALAVGTHCLGQGVKSPQLLVEAVECAQSKDDLSEALREMLAGLSAEELHALCTSDNHTIACRANWELVRQTLPHETTYDEDGLSQAQQVKRLPFARFLGFVEGRFRVTTPEWWGQLFLRAKAFDRQMLANHLPLLNREVEAYYETEILRPNVDMPLRVRAGIEVAARDENMLTIRNEAAIECDISRRLLENSSASHVLCQFRENYCVVGLFRAWALGPFRISCIDHESSETLWSAGVWAGQPLSAGHVDPHVATVVIVDDTVFVFGADPWSIYMEGFDLASGRPTVRFSTAYE